MNRNFLLPAIFLSLFDIVAGICNGIVNIVFFNIFGYDDEASVLEPDPELLDLIGSWFQEFGPGCTFFWNLNKLSIFKFKNFLSTKKW